MRGLMPELDGLPQQNIEIILAEVIEAVVPGTMAGPGPRTAAPGAHAAERVGRDQGDGAVIDPEGGVERGREPPGDFDRLGGGHRRIPLPQGDQVGVARQRPVEGRLEAQRGPRRLGGDRGVGGQARPLGRGDIDRDGLRPADRGLAGRPGLGRGPGALETDPRVLSVGVGGHLPRGRGEDRGRPRLGSGGRRRRLWDRGGTGRLRGIGPGRSGRGGQQGQAAGEASAHRSRILRGIRDGRGPG